MIRPVTNFVSKYAEKGFRGIAKSNLMKKFSGKFETDTGKFVMGVSITSMLLKDGLGCYMYVTQSLNNDKIPKEKRAFVAALDLTNGGLMILAQLLMFLTISNAKFQNKMFNKMFGSLFERASRKSCQELLKSTDKFKNINGAQFHKAFNRFHKDCKEGMKMFTALVASTIIAKRVIVPFIATPMASWAKTNILKVKDSDAKPPCNEYFRHYPYVSLSDIVKYLEHSKAANYKN